MQFTFSTSDAFMQLRHIFMYRFVFRYTPLFFPEFVHWLFFRLSRFFALHRCYPPLVFISAD